VLASLRETARLFATHYSTMIEGNRLTQEQVGKVITHQEHFPGRERDEKEVLSRWKACLTVSSMGVCPSQKIVDEDADRRRPIDGVEQAVIRQV
jgi:hypothetical protein